MSAIGPFAIPALAVGAFAATIGWFGYQHLTARPVEPSGIVKVEPASVETGPKATPAPTEAARPAQPPKAGNGAAAAPGEPPSTAPAFDVVRVEPTGDTVVAGRAAPGASVELVLNGVRHSRVVADPSGLFAVVPEPLPPGSHELVLQVTNGDGTRLRSPQSVTVVVAANKKHAPLVTITTPGQPAVVLSRPDGGTQVASSQPAAAPEKAPAATGRAASAGSEASKSEGGGAGKARKTVQIAAVETEGAGRLLVSGSASPAAVVRLYLNDTFIAPASAGQDGRISFSIERGMQPGAYKVRLDDVDPVSGQVRSRAEVPFEMPVQVAAAAAVSPSSSLTGSGAPSRVASVSQGAGATATDAATSPVVVVPEINTAIVSRGESLWAISKRTYGQGLRYSIIYGANAKQIRDPDLIYPGQVFVLPANASDTAAR